MFVGPYKHGLISAKINNTDSMTELKNVFLDVKTFRKYIVTSCRLFADKDDRYTIDTR